jgi:hypothetical protein
MVAQGRIRRFEPVPIGEFSTAPPLAGPFWLTPDGPARPPPKPAANPVVSATSARWPPPPPRSRFEAGGQGSDRDSGPSRSPPVVHLSNSRTLGLPPSLVDGTVPIGPRSGREIGSRESCGCRHVVGARVHQFGDDGTAVGGIVDPHSGQEKSPLQS